MGCSVSIGLDPKTKNLIAELYDKIDDFYNSFVK